jgi:ArsR family transcriptional regulator
VAFLLVAGFGFQLLAGSAKRPHRIANWKCDSSPFRAERPWSPTRSGGIISMMVEQSKHIGTTDLAGLFRALGDPNRLAIFELIRERCGTECSPVGDPTTTVSRLAEEFDLALSTVSHHLKELRRARLITCERRGQQVFCSVNDEALRLVERFGSTAGGAPADMEAAHARA